ncbi:alkaline phosphatase family protein [soil metagenome]
MLPAPKPDGLSLADVLESCLASISGEPSRLGLARVDRAVVLLVDGLGAQALTDRIGHARTLAAAFTPKAVIESGFPSTTAAAIASLTTGVRPGQHGIVGYSVLDPAHDRVVNQLSGWDDRIDPFAWQPIPTIFQRAERAGLLAVAIGPERYRESGFSAAVLRGARYVAAASIADRMARAAEFLAEPGPPGLAYVYVPELDSAAHAHGTESREWTNALETTDAAARDLVAALGKRHGLIVTADHGLLDIPQHGHIRFDESPALVDGVRFVAGEPRCLQLHFEPDASASVRDRTVEAWRAAESGRSWVATRDEAVAADWFGPVRAGVGERIGDLLVAARKNVAYYDSRAGTHGTSMIGQHGSWSPAETRVPVLRYGAFAG